MATLEMTAPAPARELGGWARGTTATVVVGASFPVSAALVAYPFAAGQLIRYAGGALILTALLKGRLGLPTVREFVLLALVAAVGMVGFNFALLGAVDQIGATNTGVIVGASPVFLALAVATRSRYVLGCAGLVVAGAAIVNGVDPRLTALGLALAVAALPGRGRLHAARRPADPAPGPDARGRLGGVAGRDPARAAHPPHPDPDGTQRPPRSPISRSSPPRSGS